MAIEPHRKSLGRSDDAFALKIMLEQKVSGMTLRRNVIPL